LYNFHLLNAIKIKLEYNVVILLAGEMAVPGKKSTEHVIRLAKIIHVSIVNIGYTLMQLIAMVLGRQC